jgi:hypothetical protein
MEKPIVYRLILVLFVMSFISCEKHEDEIIGLKGTWVGTYDNNDTIIFKSSSKTGLFEFNRGYETRNGLVLPKSGSGLYSYKISDNSINVWWLLSSSSYRNGTNVYFKLNKTEKRFQIGIFAIGFVTDLYIVDFQKIK